VKLTQRLCSVSQNHERDWPYSGDRFLNLATDSGVSHLRQRDIVLFILPMYFHLTYSYA